MLCLDTSSTTKTSSDLILFTVSRLNDVQAHGRGLPRDVRQKLSSARAHEPHNLATQRETNLERSAAAAPSPPCRTAPASFGPENYLAHAERPRQTQTRSG